MAADIEPVMECLCMGETAAAGGVFMGLGLRGVRGSGVAEAVGVTVALPLVGGPCEALSKLLISVLTVGEGSEEVEDRRLRPIPCLRAARSLSTAFM